MPKMTLLDMTQDILTSMESDEVNSITDSKEALDVAKIIQRTYFDLISNKDIPEHATLFQLEGLGNANYPTIMKIPNLIHNVSVVKYDKRSSATDTVKNFSDVYYCKPEDFLNRTNIRDNTASNVSAISDSTITNSTEVLILTDANPDFYTVFDDEHIVFDAHNSAIDSTLAASKTQCWGHKEPTFTLSDTFVPDIDVQYFPYLYHAAKVVCFADLKQQANQVSASFASSHKTKNQNNKHRVRVANNQHRPDYGRRSRYVKR